MVETMKLTLIRKLVVVSTFALTSIIPWLAADASPFYEQEVNQEEIMAIARPYGGNKYDLSFAPQLQFCW